MCLATLPMNESEARDDLVLIETSLLFFCKFQLSSIIRKAQVAKHMTVKISIVGCVNGKNGPNHFLIGPDPVFFCSVHGLSGS